MFSLERLEVWQKAVDLANPVYAETKSFPGDERFGLTSQLRRAVGSVSAHIAEGGARSSADFATFPGSAAGSL